MTVEPAEQGRPETRHAVNAGRPGVLERDSSRRSGPSAASGFRLLLVFVPLLIIAGGGAYLLNFWTSRLLEAPPAKSAPKGFARETERRPGSGGIVTQQQPTQQIERPFDTGLVVALLAKASPEAGATAFKICAVCHTAEKHGAHKVGSNLWDIVGKPIASLPGFNYSAALKAKRGVWSYRALAEYLSNPREFAPGTSMTFFGIRDERRVADLIAYMRTLSDTPAPLPR